MRRFQDRECVTKNFAENDGREPRLNRSWYRNGGRAREQGRDD